MATQVQQVQPRSLWGRLASRAARKERPAAPIAAAPTHRPLTVKDALWTVDAQTGRRQYVPLTVNGVPGKWAGREWQHCGERDGLLMARWPERDNAAAPLCWRSLASGSVMLTEGGQAA